MNTYPGLPDTLLADRYDPAVRLAVRVLESEAGKDIWEVALSTAEYQRAPNLGARVDTALQLLKDIADVSLLSHPNTVMKDARPQLDLWSFRQYVRDRVVQLSTAHLPDGTDTR